MSNETQLDLIKDTQALAVKEEARRQMMEDAGIESKDLSIPRIQLMQPTSEMVGDNKAKNGDIVKVDTNEVIGGVDNPLEIVPLSLYKTVVIEDMSVKPPKFIRQEALNSSNEKLPWEDTENGKPIKRTHCFNFFVLLSKDVAEGAGFPTVVRFKSTSMAAGRQLATHLYKMISLDRLPYSKAVSLEVKREKKEQNTYAVFSIGKTRDATPEEIQVASDNWSALKALKAKVDAIQEGSDAAHAAPTPSVVQSSVESDVSF